MSGRWERPRWPMCTTAILKTRPVAYTTVMTVMKKLARKGFLHCDSSGARIPVHARASACPGSGRDSFRIFSTRSSMGRPPPWSRPWFGARRCRRKRVRRSRRCWRAWRERRRTMVELLEWIGRGSLAPFGAPVLIWTGLAGAVAVSLTMARGLHPLMGYRLRQAVLLALPTSILVALWLPSVLGRLPGSPFWNRRAMRQPQCLFLPLHPRRWGLPSRHLCRRCPQA